MKLKMGGQNKLLLEQTKRWFSANENEELIEHNPDNQIIKNEINDFIKNNKIKCGWNFSKFSFCGESNDKVFLNTNTGKSKKKKNTLDCFKD